MKKIGYIAAFAAGVIVCAGSIYIKTTFGKGLPAMRITPAEMVWNADPKLHGLKTAVLAGDPDATGPFAERIVIPPNTQLPPHSHKSRNRMVTVVSGTIYFGYGDNFDKNGLKALPAGSFFTEPDGKPHYAVTGKDGVVLQLDAIGPDGTKYTGK